MTLARRIRSAAWWLVYVGYLTVAVHAEAQACKAKEVEEQEQSLLPLPLTIVAVVFLVMCSGLFSGLTIGLMGLDLIGLETVENGGDPSSAKAAAQIKPVRARGNLLLCTLLLGNVAVNSALSILSASVASGTVGFFVSTALIVIFGEIVPQAACSKYALQTGARTVWIVKFLMVLFFVITYPLSIMLDCLLGKDLGQVYSTSELKEMVKLQIEKGAVDEVTGQMAKQIVEGALNFRTKSVVEVMTPLEDAYMLQKDAVLNYETIRQIFEHGFSRIPVYGKDKNDYVGLLHTKDLILVDPEDEMVLEDFIKIFNRQVLQFRREATLVDAFTAFKQGRAHLALVRDMELSDATQPRCQLLGVLTLEDVVEEILQEEIVDEADVYVDVDTHLPVNDGRERRKFNLDIFNPHGIARSTQLSEQEVCAIALHLHQTVFAADGPMPLTALATQYLVVSSKVVNMVRQSPAGSEQPHPSDVLYKVGHPSSACMLVLQGRACVRVGGDEFRTEVGAFTILARDALIEDEFVSDFTGCVSTCKARFLQVSRNAYQMAKQLETDPSALQYAINARKVSQLSDQIYGSSRDGTAGELTPEALALTSIQARWDAVGGRSRSSSDTTQDLQPGGVVTRWRPSGNYANSTNDFRKIAEASHDALTAIGSVDEHGLNADTAVRGDAKHDARPGAGIRSVHFQIRTGRAPTEEELLEVLNNDLEGRDIEGYGSQVNVGGAPEAACCPPACVARGSCAYQSRAQEQLSTNATGFLKRVEYAEPTIQQAAGEHSLQQVVDQRHTDTVMTGLEAAMIEAVQLTEYSSTASEECDYGQRSAAGQWTGDSVESRKAVAKAVVHEAAVQTHSDHTKASERGGEKQQAIRYVRNRVAAIAADVEAIGHESTELSLRSRVKQHHAEHVATLLARSTASAEHTAAAGGSQADGSRS